MVCEHDFSEKDTEIADGACPICLSIKIQSAIDLIVQYGGIDGSHHKQWTLDQVLRILSEERYNDLIKKYCDGEDGENTYEWDCGITP